jgi:hypothetical protein
MKVPLRGVPVIALSVQGLRITGAVDRPSPVNPEE